MKQAVLQAPEDIRLVEAPRPGPEPNELLVAVAQVGICGSDLHAYHGRHPFIELPVVPGHEFAGTVVELGSEVCDFTVGQRVTVEPSSRMTWALSAITSKELPASTCSGMF